MTETIPTHEETHHSPAKWYTCSGFQRDILLGITTHQQLDESPYGAALHEWLDARYPTAVVRSRVYHNLGDLVELGLLARQPRSHRKTVYRLTDTGRQCLAAHGRVVAALDLPDLAPETDRA